MCLWTVNVAVVIAVVVVVGSHLKQREEQTPETAPVQGPAPASPPTPPAPTGQPPAPPATPPSPPAKSPAAPAPTAPPAAMPAPTPKGPKLIGDLKVTQIALDQPKGAKGSRLVYVTGLLKNDSDHQRLGVRVELDLLDAAGNKVGTATDYRQTVEPRATWQFRAIVTDRRATAAKLVGVKEDE